MPPTFGLNRRFSSASRISMSLKAGIVGLPNVGKSTLFNAVVSCLLGCGSPDLYLAMSWSPPIRFTVSFSSLLNPSLSSLLLPGCLLLYLQADTAFKDYICGIDAHQRIHILSDLSRSHRAVPASIEFVDIAGHVKGASHGLELGSKFLSHIREVDSILQVVRCFQDIDIVHVNGKVDPKSDIYVINLELIFSDVDQIQKRIEKLKKSNGKNSQSKLKKDAERSALERIEQALMDGKPARSVTLTDFEKDSIKHLCLLTMKPVIYVANVAESDLAEPENNPHVNEIKNLASELQSGLVTISEIMMSEKKLIEIIMSKEEINHKLKQNLLNFRLKKEKSS